ncbi:MAG: SDR family oxidoreductase [Eubacteriales bacterium]|nr:SDR family oxidoreductase [Eubacteriales bacterium]
MRFDGQCAIITGAGGGVGRATAMRLAREGARVVLADVNLPGALEVQREIQAEGGDALAVEADVRLADSVNAMVETARAHFGPVDILVNNAGGSARLIGKKSWFWESEESTWDWTFGVNLKGPFLCARAVICQMMERRSGKIINVASVAGVCGLEEMVDYSAAKSGIIGMTRALAMEVGRYNINVNCVSPGTVSSWSQIPPEATYLGRGGKPEEIANLIAFLASHEADYITGANYLIDGGRTLGPKAK